MIIKLFSKCQIMPKLIKYAFQGNIHAAFSLALYLSLFLCCPKWRASIRMIIWDLISIWMVFKTNPILLNWNWILMDALTCIVQTMRTVSLEILRPMANMIISQRCFYSVVLFISIFKFSRIKLNRNHKKRYYMCYKT